MKFTLFLISYLFLFESHAQTNQAVGKVIYKMELDLGIPKSGQFVLFFDATKTVFMKDESIKPKVQENTNDTEVTYIKTDVTPYHLFDFEKDSIFSQSLVFTTPYYVADKIYKPKWQIVKEYKTIGNYNCQKATAAFRGRNYQAWFCEAIPVNFGPWKFNGLPGLILEIEDEMKVFKLSALSIELGTSIDFDFSFSKYPITGKKVSMKEFVVYKDKEGIEATQYFLSKQDRTSETQQIFYPSKRNDIELIYEWEENDKK